MIIPNSISPWRFICIFVFSLSLLASCQVYHNTTSRFNAYFLANERFEQVYKNSLEEQQSDFNNILRVLPQLDSNSVGTWKGELDYVVEKASLPIQRHPESDWTDDSYLLIGKARLFQADYRNAINTFRYLNGQSEETDIRHASLIWLMRTFVESGNLDRAAFTLDYISKEGEEFSETNIGNFYLTAAHYYRTLEDFDRTATYLELALPYVNGNKRKARYYFILGQIYQSKKQDQKAYDYYQKTIRSFPTYEMVFNAQLSASQVAGTDSESVRQTQKYFDKLLRDQKNEEYKDRIYYEMASFEQKRGNTKEAIQLLQKSLGTPSENANQKAYTYVKLGEIYYANSDYEKANNYYDSALLVSDQQMRDYEVIEARAAILNQFFEQYSTVRRQDELLKLSKMSQEELVAYFEKEIEEEKKAIDEERELVERRAKLTSATAIPQNPFGDGSNQTQAQAWYFYNPQAIRQGKNEFARVWRNRPLEDNWRRSNRVSSNLDNNILPDVTQSDAQVEQEPLYANVASVEDRLEEVPQTKEEIALIDNKLKTALFELGKVYHYQLKENENAVKTLERFVGSYPKNSNTAEALFLLRKICSEATFCEDSKYEKQLLENYPSSSFARIIKNPDFLELSAANDTTVSRLYRESYAFYKQRQPQEALQLLNLIQNSYPENSYNAKVDLLKIMIESSQIPLKSYIQALQTYIKNYESAEEANYAQNLLQIAEQKAEATSQGSQDSTAVGGGG